uniref:Odorant receptor n=1 Tax=Glossina pallidipes TaxID=7398 RepID=A0A1B0A2L0_GLOPL
MTIKIVQSLNQLKQFDDYIWFPNAVLKTIGYEFPQKPTSKWLLCLKRALTLLEISAHFYCSGYSIKQMYDIAQNGMPNVPLFLRLTSSLMYTISGDVKLLNFVIHLKQSKTMFKRFQDIYPQSLEELHSYRVNQHFWPSWVNVILYFYLVSTFFIIISPIGEAILLYIYELLTVGYAEAHFSYLKCYEITYSFDHRSPLAYALAYSLESFYSHFIVIGNISVDIWLLSYAMQLCMHFDYISRELEMYEPNEEHADADIKFIADLVSKHQIVLRLSNEINTIFGMLLLFLLLSMCGVLCCVGVYMMVMGMGRELLTYVAFLLTAVGQYYVICYYGQRLIILSKNIGNSAYNHRWYMASPSYKKSILIILIRAQKEADLNANGMQPISFEAFKIVT